MTTSSRARDLQGNQEGNQDDQKSSKDPATSRQWSTLKHPRIVRVSRTFGGKDRHSKVCTVRGLRDRRIRLSVPTAIQVYKLQERLGLSQPSKVLDWLLDVTKDEIDKLPPLQLPQGNFIQIQQPNLNSQEADSRHNSTLIPFDMNSTFGVDFGSHSFVPSERGIKINENHQRESKYWNCDASLRAKNKEVERDAIVGKPNWIHRLELENQYRSGECNPQLPAQNLFPRATHSSFPSFINSATTNSLYYPWQLPSSSLNHFGVPSQTLPFTSPSALPTASQLFYPSYPSYFTSLLGAREMNHMQLLSSNVQHTLPNPLMPYLHLQNNNETPRNNNNTADS